MYSQYLGFMYFGILLVLGIFRESVLQILLILQVFWGPILRVLLVLAVFGPSVLLILTVTRSIQAVSTLILSVLGVRNVLDTPEYTLSTRSIEHIRSVCASFERLGRHYSQVLGSCDWRLWQFHISQVLRLPGSIIRVFSRKSTPGTLCTRNISGFNTLDTRSTLSILQLDTAGTACTRG